MLALGFCYNRWQAAVEESGGYRATIEIMENTAKKVAADNDRVVEQWRLANVHIKSVAASQRADLAAELNRVRGSPVRADGSSITITSCPEPRADGLSAKLIPLADYESLQSRAAGDALQVTLLQDYITDVCLVRTP